MESCEGCIYLRNTKEEYQELSPEYGSYQQYLEAKRKFEAMTSGEIAERWVGKD